MSSVSRRSFPSAASWKGQDALLRLFRRMCGASWDDVVVDRLGILTDENYFCLQLRMTMTSKLTGNRISTSLAGTPRAASMGSMVEYADPLPRLRAGRRRSRAAAPGPVELEGQIGMDRLKGKVAIITGAAKGLGAADARLFVAEGARVILTDVDDAAGSALAAELGAMAEYQHLDVTSEAAWEALVADIVARHGRLDVLVNECRRRRIRRSRNADRGRLPARSWPGASIDGVVFGTKHADPGHGCERRRLDRQHGLDRRDPGRTDVCRLQRRQGRNRCLYPRDGSRLFDQEPPAACAPSSVLPAGIDTPMVRSLGGGKLADLGAAAPVRDNATAMNRLGEPVDVANLVLFLASDESRFINGQSHVIDDGASIIAGGAYRAADR
jgi:3(or 17)beta-hydroxysteroid dehydrogenase